jgi:hypothetical protein
VAPRQVIDPPAFSPLSFGLLSVVQTPPPDGVHWRNGVTWQDRCLVDMGATTYDECISVTGTGAPPEPSPKSGNVDQTLRGATPVTTYTEFDCSPVGNPEATKIASDALNQSSPWQVERAFWTGSAGGQDVVFPHLAADAQVLDVQDIVLQSAASIPVTGSFDAAEGLGLLEAGLADCYGGAGVIHIPRFALPTFQAWGLLDNRAGVLRTTNGNLVAVGSGYPGTSPAGVAPASGTSWIYATGPVFAYVGDVKVNSVRDSMDRAENTIKMIAERTYVLGYSCCLFALNISLGTPVT